MFIAMLSAVYDGGHDYKQFEIDRLAQRVIDKYERMSCLELSFARGEIDEVNERVISVLRTDANMRKKFINRVAAPVANKLFECRLIS